VVFVTLAVLAAFGLAYVGARETSLFAVDELEITGAPPEVRRDVRAALAPLLGTSLVKLDASDVERDLRELPSVLDAEVDRGFPHALRIVVAPERVLAVVKEGEVAWIVSRRGHVIRAAAPEAGRDLPRIRTPSAGGLGPGRKVTEAEAAATLAVLAAVPADFPVRIRSARTGEGGVTVVLAAETELRLGTADDLEAKFAAAGAVLGTMSWAERRALAYLDVSLPQRPVGLGKSQV
jgi:cell division protein FtsQ